VRIVLLGNHRTPHTSESHHAATLEAMGHEVVRLQESEATGAEVLFEAQQADLLVVVHTHRWDTPGMPLHEVLQALKRTGVPTLTYHLDLYLGLYREKDLDDVPLYRALDHFFTVDPQMATWLNENTDVKGHFIPAGVYEPECYISTEPSEHANDVIFVGSWNYHREWPWRVRLLLWLNQTYGDRFTHIGPDSRVGGLRGDDLNRAYAHSKVAVGDTLCPGYDYPLYHSDRLWEAGGRGAAQVFPRVPGIDRWFTEGEHLLYYDYGDFDGLRKQIDWMLDHEDEREKIRLAGHEMVKATGTYRHRWEEVLGTVIR